jgi:hypothetical protein
MHVYLFLFIRADLKQEARCGGNRISNKKAFMLSFVLTMLLKQKLAAIAD